MFFNHQGCRRPHIIFLGNSEAAETLSMEKKRRMGRQSIGARALGGVVAVATTRGRVSRRGRKHGDSRNVVGTPASTVTRTH